MADRDWYFGQTFALVRFDQNGSLDSTFDGDGWAVSQSLNGGSGAVDLAIRPDGKIAASGSYATDTGFDMTVALFDTNGSLDASFGNAGIATVDFGGDEHASSVIVQPDGKLILGGSSGDWWSSHFTLARLTVDGQLDRSFGRGTGKVTTHVTDDGLYGTAWLSQIALEPDGRIVAAGTTDAGYGSDFFVVRYMTSGEIDHAFGDQGKVITDFGSNQYEDCADMAIQPDGKIVVVGRTNQPLTGSDVAMARYEAGPMYNQYAASWNEYLAAIDWLSALDELGSED